MIPVEIKNPAVEAEKYVTSQLESQLNVTVNNIGCGDDIDLASGVLKCNANITHEGKEYETAITVGVEKQDNSFIFKLQLPDLKNDNG